MAPQTFGVAGQWGRWVSLDPELELHCQTVDLDAESYVLLVGLPAGEVQ